MKYIEIREGLSIAADKIEAVEYLTELTCKVITKFQSYEANFPYLVLLQLLEERDEERDKKVEQINNIMKQQTNPAW